MSITIMATYKIVLQMSHNRDY